MKERELRKRLLTDPVPEELEAGQRVWPTVRAAWEGRERVSWAERRARPILALAAAAVLVGAFVSPPGRVAAGWLREQVAAEEENGRPLLRLPTTGRLLVESGQGPWVVQRDGSRRLLGPYEEATWSPRGKFVAVTAGRRLTAVEPDGTVRWQHPRPEPVSDPRWAPSGFRIAYRSGDSLRVIVGDGTRDRLLAEDIGVAAPAWRPGSAHVLAYADQAGGINIVNLDTGGGMGRTHVAKSVRQLFWSADGSRLGVLVGDRRVALYRADGKFVRTIAARRGRAILSAAFAPAGRDLAVADYSHAGGGSVLVVRPRTGATRVLLQIPGRLEQVAWAPNRRWILAAAPAADQWLFVQTARPSRFVTVSQVTREFDPGATGQDAFPHVAGWCCP